MKRKLNPDLVWDKRGDDRQFPSDEHWVFLREPIISGDTKEAGIGPTEIEEIPETEAERDALKQQINETETALSAHAGVHPNLDISQANEVSVFSGTHRM